MKKKFPFPLFFSISLFYLCPFPLLSFWASLLIQYTCREARGITFTPLFVSSVDFDKYNWEIIFCFVGNVSVFQRLLNVYIKIILDCVNKDKYILHWERKENGKKET